MIPALSAWGSGLRPRTHCHGQDLQQLLTVTSGADFSIRAPHESDAKFFVVFDVSFHVSFGSWTIVAASFSSSISSAESWPSRSVSSLLTTLLKVSTSTCSGTMLLSSSAEAVGASSATTGSDFSSSACSPGSTLATSLSSAASSAWF